MNRSDKEVRDYIYSYVKRTLSDVMEEIGRLSKDIHKVRKQQQRARSVQRKKEPSILSYKSTSLVERRLQELEKVNKDRVRMADKDR